MALLNLKPTRKQLLELLCDRVNHAQQTEYRRIDTQMREIDAAVQARIEEWKEQSFQQAQSDPLIAALAKFAHKHGIEISKHITSDGNGNDVLSVALRAEIPIDRRTEPKITDDERKQKDKLYDLQRVATCRVTPDTVMEHLADSDPDTKQLLEDMAEKVSSRIHRQGQLLIESK